MSVRAVLIAGLLFLLLAWAGSAAIAYAVVEMAGDGPRGEQGPPGPAGPAGPEGPRGLSGYDEALVVVKRLASLWAVQTVSVYSGGEFVNFENPLVKQCVDYILNGGNYEDCPGFSR